jgi:hypothetical protein
MVWVGFDALFSLPVFSPSLSLSIVRCAGFSLCYNLIIWRYDLPFRSKTGGFWWPYSFLIDYLIILLLLLDHALQKKPQTAENNFVEMLFENHFSVNSLSVLIVDGCSLVASVTYILVHQHSIHWLSVFLYFLNVNVISWYVVMQLVNVNVIGLYLAGLMQMKSVGWSIGQ